jgi:hypothetical protein
MCSTASGNGDAVAVSTIAVTQAQADLALIRNLDVDEFEDNDAAGDALERLGTFVNAVAERFPAPDGFGEKLSVRDLNGKRLRIGDTVKVFNSQRYGNPTGQLLGLASGVGSQGQRVRIRLDSGENYTPSVGRVERLVKAEAVTA